MGESVRVVVEPRRIELRRPVMTPVGAFDAVWETRLRVAAGGADVEGRARCRTEAEAVAVAAAATAMEPVVCALLLGVSGDAAWWGAWTETWRRLEAAAEPGPSLLALSAWDAAAWELRELVAPPPAPPPAGGSRHRVYWSGFWLGEDDARVDAEAAMVAAAGYDGVKMRLDPADVAATQRTFTRLRALLPPSVAIAVECAGGASLSGVDAFVAGVDGSAVAWLEDPVPAEDEATMAAIARDTPVRIASGEDCWRAASLPAYVERSGAAVPIIDLGRVGGPTGALLVLEAAGVGWSEVGIHLDARLAALLARRVAAPPTIWVEVMDWWEPADPAALRALLAGISAAPR